MRHFFLLVQAALAGAAAGVGVGAAVAWARARRAIARAESATSLAMTRAAVSEARAAQSQAHADELRARAANLAADEARLRARLEGTLVELSEARCAQRLAAEHAAAEVATLAEVRQSFADHFKSLSQEVLTEKAALFDRQQRSGLAALVEPLQRELTSFRQRVDEVWRREGEERASLGTQLSQMSAVAQGLGEEARALSQALRGDHRALGDWGEMVLERLLTACGLSEGADFEVQKTFEDGERRARPDVVVHLPHQRDIVIDAKVSLSDYYDRVQAKTDADARAAAARLAQALRAHVRGLAGKRYAHLTGVHSLDCTLLFVPIEPAFLCALEADPDLWAHAWAKNIVLVCPTTLLCVLRIVADQWRQARISQHAQDIVGRGIRLHDKFAAMAGDFEQVGQRLDQAHGAYQSLRAKMTGRGGLVSQFVLLRKAGGLNASREIPAGLTAGLEHDEAAAEALPDPSRAAPPAPPALSVR